MDIRGWIIALVAGALSIGGVLFAAHYRDLSAAAARVPGLEQDIRDRDAQAKKDADRIGDLDKKLADADAKRQAAEGTMLAVQTAIQNTAEATAEELASAIPDNPSCPYSPDVGRLLGDQLAGIRPAGRQ